MNKTASQVHIRSNQKSKYAESAMDKLEKYYDNGQIVERTEYGEVVLEYSDDWGWNIVDRTQLDIRFDNYQGCIDMVDSFLSQIEQIEGEQ